jgi:hypothetical protein
LKEVPDYTDKKIPEIEPPYFKKRYYSDEANRNASRGDTDVFSISPAAVEWWCPDWGRMVNDHIDKIINVIPKKGLKNLLKSKNTFKEIRNLSYNIIWFCR